MRKVHRLTRQDLAEKDARLALCARMQNPLLLSLGEALFELRTTRKHERLGFPSFYTYVRQRVQRGETASRDLALMAGRLRALPALREAFRQSRITLSVAQALARVAAPEDDRWFAAMAPISTVRQVRAALKAWNKEAVTDLGDDDDPPRMVTRSATWAERVFFLGAVMRLERVVGLPLKGSALMEALLSQVELSLLDKAPYPDKGFDDDRHAQAIIAKEENLAARLDAEARAEPLLPRPPPVEAPGEPEIPTDPVALDEVIVGISGTLAGLELEIAKLANEVMADDGWKRLGFASRQQYAAERAGMSLRTLVSRRRLGRAVAAVPELGKAVQSRKVGLTVATMVAGVANEQSASAWIERSEVRTVKHLQEEVEAARLHGSAAPPTGEQLEHLFELRRQAIGIIDTASSRQMSAPPAPGVRPPLRLQATEYWHDKWCFLERMWRLAGSPFGTFLTFCAWAVWDSYPPEEADFAYLAVHLRDGWQCTSPVCASPNVTPHHQSGRRADGTDPDDGVTSGCWACHLNLIHILSSLYVTGRAPNQLTWTIGPAEARFVVEGREVIRLPRSANAA